MTIEFSAAIAGSSTPDSPFTSSDIIPLIRDGTVYKIPVTTITGLGMALDASDATLPDARTNLGLGTTSNVDFAGLDLVGPSGIISTARILSVAYGTAGTPLPTSPTSGGSAASFTVYATPGTGVADAITVALQGDTHLTAGSRGIAVGGVFRGYTSGTWDHDSSFNAGCVGVWVEGHSSRGGVVHGGFFGAYADTTAIVGGGANGIEIDMAIAVSTPAKYGLAIVSATGDTGAATASTTVAISGASVLQSAAILVQAPIAGGTGFKYGIITIDGGVEQPIQTAGSLWRSGGYTVTNGLDWPDMAFSGYAITTPGFTVNGTGTIQVSRALASDAKSTFIKLQNTSASDATWSGIAAVSYAGADEARIDFITNSLSNFRTGIALSTNSGAGLAERMRFDHNSGNLLIGTTTDSGKILCVGTGFTVDLSGNVTGLTYKLGAKQFVSNDGSYTYIRDGSGVVDVILLGPTGDPTNYYDRTTHQFRINGGSANVAAISASGMKVGAAPTGGFKGAGTINAGGAIYDNGTAPTGTAGSGYVRATAPSIESPVLTGTPNLGTATATSITGLSAPTAGSDAVNKTYADGIASGNTWHPSAAAGTTVNLNATAAGTGVGHTLTNNGALAALVLDGYTVLLNDRVLVKDQTAQDDNGIYTQTTLGTGAIAWVLTRATDFDTASASEVAQGATLIVSNGTAYPGNANSQWIETGAGPFTVDTTPIVFDRPSSAASGTVNSGTANQLGYYVGSGTAISGLTTANSGVLVTSGGGVPSISSSLPSALAIPSPTFSGTVAGSSTIPNAVLVNSSLTVGTTTISLGGTSLTLDGVTSYNKITITAPATGSTLTIVDGKTFTVNKTLTLEGTDGTTLTLPTTNKTLMATDYSNGTTLTANAFLTGGGAATAPNAVALTGIIKGNGASAPTAVTAPSGAIVGTTDTQTLSAKTLTGTATNDSAPAGAIGEFLSATGTAVPVTSTTQTNIASLALTPGDWDVSANIKFNPAATTTSTVRAGGLSLTSATLPVSISVSESLARETGAITAGQGGWSAAIATVRVSTTGTPTIYCVGRFTFATSTATADCVIRARRVR